MKRCFWIHGILCMLLFGCSTNYVLHPEKQNSIPKHPSINIVRINPTLAVPTKVSYGFDVYLHQALLKRIPRQTKPLTVEYQITHYRQNKFPKGNSLFKRIAKTNDNEIHVGVTIKNPAGKVLDHIDIQGIGGTQLIGNAVDQALRHIASDIALHTKKVVSKIG